MRHIVDPTPATPTWQTGAHLIAVAIILVILGTFGALAAAQADAPLSILLASLLTIGAAFLLPSIKASFRSDAA
ncbi:MAG: hypothetical protein Q4C87_09595 [Actinomycetaceae bacterium]|nr:hypothetical protein [Actinomycetaceae bacterium]